ncbi:MAG: hypothetical protein ACLQNE_41485 [Thermoguttaceae bacterium]
MELAGVTSILLLGDINRAEFDRALSAMEGLAKVTPAADIEAAAALLAESTTAADLIVVAQAYPGQYSVEAIERLRMLAPLARVVGLLGSWCEGEGRSGKPWPGAIRIYWHQWPARCRQELSLLCRGLASTWSLPPTAGEEERLLALDDYPLPAGDGLVVIYSLEFDMQDWLASACRRGGYSTVWLRPHQSIRVEGARAAIFDGTECLGDELAELGRLATIMGPAPVVALLNFPRVEDRDRALAAGAAAVLSKPVLVEDLLWQITESSCPRLALPAVPPSVEPQAHR